MDKVINIEEARKKREEEAEKELREILTQKAIDKVEKESWKWKPLIDPSEIDYHIGKEDEKV